MIKLFKYYYNYSLYLFLTKIIFKNSQKAQRQLWCSGVLTAQMNERI